MPREAAPTVWRATGDGAMAETLALPGATRFKLVEIRLHLSAAGAGTFTVTLDSSAGSAYDSLIASQDMAAVADYKYNVAGDPHFFSENDEIDFAWSNGDGRTWGLEVWYVDLG